MREALRLEIRDQVAAALLDADRAEPGLEQGAGVVGTDVGGDLPLPDGALADHPLRHLQHRGGVGCALAPGPCLEGKGAGRERHRGVRPLGGAALLAAGLHLAPAAGHVAQKLFRRGGGRSLGEGAADVHAGVIVGAADAGAPVGVDVDRRRHVELGGARPVADLPDREELGQAAAVAPGQRRGDVVERVRERGGDLVLVKVCGAGLDVAGVRLQPLVISGSDPVTEDVHRLGLAGEASGQLLGDEAVGTIGELAGSRRSCRGR